MILLFLKLKSKFSLLKPFPLSMFQDWHCFLYYFNNFELSGLFSIWKMYLPKTRHGPIRAYI